jgi:hypothetical protein
MSVQLIPSGIKGNNTQTMIQRSFKRQERSLVNEMIYLLRLFDCGGVVVRKDAKRVPCEVVSRLFGRCRVGREPLASDREDQKGGDDIRKIFKKLYIENN